MSGCRSCSGRLFHSVGLAVTKQRSPNWLRDLLTKHVRLSADRRRRRPWSPYSLIRDLRNAYNIMKILSLFQLSQHTRPQNSVPARITNIGVPEGLRQFSGAPKLSSAAFWPTLITVQMPFQVQRCFAAFSCYIRGFWR